jgi:DNA-binding NarL/FixJ family response regulator
VERDREVATLERAVREGGAVIVVGPYGAGKSSLLDVARALAARAGAGVLEAQGAESERGFPYGVVQQLLGEARGEDLGSVISEQRPVCVLVDDLHCADAESLAALSELVEGAGGSHIAIVAAADSDFDDADRWVAAGATPLHPASFSAEGVRRLLTHRLGVEVPADVADACREATGGLPFLVDQVVTEIRRRRHSPSVESIAAVVDAPPPAVVRMVAGRLRALPEDAVALVHSVAVLGDDASVDKLAALGLAGERAALSFACALVRSAVYRDLPVSERARLHAEAAELLTRAGASASAIARHVIHAPRHALPEAAATLAAAAAHAQQRGDFETAVRCLRRKLAESSEVDGTTLAALGSAELRLGRSEAAALTLTRALEVIEEPDGRLRAAAELGSALIHEGRAAEAVDILRPAAARAREIGSDQEHVLEATQAVAGWTDVDLFRDMPVLRDEPGAQATDGEHARRGRIAAWHALHGSAVEARRVAALDPDRRLGEWRHLVAFDLRELALVLADDAAALRALARAEAEARAAGSTLGLSILRELRVTAHLRHGELDAVELDAAATLWPLARVALAERRMEQGDLDGAAAALERTKRDGSALDLLRLLAAGRFQARRGLHRDALASFDSCARVEAKWGLAEPAHACWRSEAALAHHAVGDADLATALAAESVTRTRRYGSERLQGMALRVAARVDPRSSGEELLQEAIELLDRSGAKLEAARARADLGSVVRRRGRPREARVPLREAETLAREAGARPLLERIAGELELTGAEARREGRAIDELTPAERRTAELAADGLKNREIAAQLLLAEKTVEMQLSQVYRKLGIRSRRELAAALD